ncbi:MAG: RDD family protein [Cocleimonas sp.]|nr:RDD family protein [Cocleimonas sp.]
MTSILDKNSIPASRSQKLGALLIDSFFVILLGVISYGLATYFYDQITSSLGRDFVDFMIFSGPTIYLLTSSISYLRKGETIGNQLMKLKLIDSNTNEKPRLGKLLLRLFYKTLFISLPAVAVFLMFITYADIQGGWASLTIFIYGLASIPIVVYIMLFVDILISKNNQTWYERKTSTILVNN